MRLEAVAFRPALLAFVVLLGGCLNPNKPVIADHIYKLTLQSSQYALDLKSSGSPNAVSARLTMYGISSKGPRAVIGSGTTEISIYQDRVIDDDDNPIEPLYTWKISGDQMRAYLARVYGLVCYQITLKWPSSVKPQGDTITIQARYTGSDNIPIESVPTKIRLR